MYITAGTSKDLEDSCQLKKRSLFLNIKQIFILNNHLEHKMSLISNSELKLDRYSK